MARRAHPTELDPMTDTKREAPASPEKRAAALEIVLRRKADMPKNFVAEFTEHADDEWSGNLGIGPGFLEDHGLRQRSPRPWAPSP